MKRILTSTALVAALMTPAFASPPDADKDMKTEAEIMTETDMVVETPIVDTDADIDADTMIEAGLTDDHDWVGTIVIDAGDEVVGEVERVDLNMDGEVKAIVVETGGVLDVGGREIMVDGEQYMTVADEDGDEKIQLTLTKTAFASMPDFDEDRVSDYPLSDDDLLDGIGNALDPDTETDADGSAEIY